MKIREGNRVVELSRTNLLTLLAKLDGNPVNSACTLMKPAGDTGEVWLIKAVEDVEHYADRPRGEMHPATETAILRLGEGTG